SLDHDRRAKLGPTAGVALVDDLDVAQQVLDRLDPALGKRLLSAGLVVVRVLLEVAKLTGGDDPGDDRRARHGGELLELGLERGQARWRQPGWRPLGLAAGRRSGGAGGPGYGRCGLRPRRRRPWRAGLEGGS